MPLSIRLPVRLALPDHHWQASPDGSATEARHGFLALNSLSERNTARQAP